MKKQNLKSLKLNKKSISNVAVYGGLNSENPSDPSEEARITWLAEGCLMPSVIQNTACTCA